jgi:hypothetical protein
MKRHVSLLAASAAAISLVALAAFAAVTKASSPIGVTGTLLARGTYHSFNVRSDAIADFRAHSTSQIDVVVQKHDYAPGATTGWHKHPGPVFITVTQGQLSFYERNDPTCTPHVYSAGQGFVDSGDGHIGRNQTSQPAQDVTVAIAPVGGAFRSELPAPGPHCGF